LFIPGDIQLPSKVKEAMQMQVLHFKIKTLLFFVRVISLKSFRLSSQVEAERKKRAAILESEGRNHFMKKYPENQTH
jgi:regulator of protease activity HflC (stomatin/prohibitin superfamily)